MASGMRKRSFLAPTGKSAVDQFGVASEEIIGTDPQSFANSWAKGFTEHVGLLDESLEKSHTTGRLEVDGD